MSDIIERKKKHEDKAFDLYAEMLIKKIESSSKSEWKKPWFAEMSWPKSLYGKSYNGMNALMLSLVCEKKGYGIPVFATRDRIFSLNFKDGKIKSGEHELDKDGNRLPFVHVLKGEHSFPVFLTSVTVIKKDSIPRVKIPWSEYVKLSSEEKEDYNVYTNRRVYDVFNIDQTNIKEARPELYKKLLDENRPKQLDVAGDVFTFKPLDLMVEDNLWICPINPQYGDDASYNDELKTIVIPLKEQFAAMGNSKAYYSVMLHEMVHSTGAEDYLNRLKPSLFGSPDYAREELVAELGSAILSKRYGLCKHIKEDSIPYVQSWLKALHEKPEFIRTVLKDIKTATNFVDVRIEQVRRERLEESLDVREENESTLEFDESGDAHLGYTESLVSDKKQGEGEGKDSVQEKHEPYHSTGIHR